jgi:beta-N-acetylhexosaminidase
MTLPVIFGLAGPVMSPDEQAFFRDVNPAGYILFARNIETPAQLRALTDALRELRGDDQLPILIDQEGGRVARLGAPHWRDWPAAATLAQGADGYSGVVGSKVAERVRLNYEALGLELAAAGVTVTCAPVLDVPQADAHDIIGDRAFGNTPDQVAALGRACLEGLAVAGIAGVIKHIPGHGRALSDSHESLPRVAADAASLAVDCLPFSELSDATMAMTAHVVYEAWDMEHCASVSARVIEGQIRGRIGFDGLLMSDDLDMKALSGDLPSRAVAVLEAGCDIALNCWGRFDDMTEIANAVPAMTDVAERRLLRARSTLRIAQNTEALAARLAALIARRDALY